MAVLHLYINLFGHVSVKLSSLLTLTLTIIIDKYFIGEKSDKFRKIDLMNTPITQFYIEQKANKENTATFYKVASTLCLITSSSYFLLFEALIIWRTHKNICKSLDGNCLNKRKDNYIM